MLYISCVKLPRIDILCVYALYPLGPSGKLNTPFPQEKFGMEGANLIYLAFILYAEPWKSSGITTCGLAEAGSALLIAIPTAALS
jgi:hypothetical protein